MPCAAGWINATLDPEGVLYHCGQVSRADRSNNVVTLGAQAAFERLERTGCPQCWCARVVEENYLWGGYLGQFLPLSALTRPRATGPSTPLQRTGAFGQPRRICR